MKIKIEVEKNPVQLTNGIPSAYTPMHVRS